MDLRRTIAVTVAVWYAVGGLAGAATLEGRVQLRGDIPTPVMVPRELDVAFCGSASNVSPRLDVTGEGYIRNAVVFLPDVPRVGPDPDPVVMDQLACEYVPHVVWVPQGGQVRFVNSDPGLHEVRAFQEHKMLMHFGHPQRAGPIDKIFEALGPAIIRCGLHPWMHAWVYVAGEGRYTITDAEGRFFFDDIAPGQHAVAVWHEVLGEHKEAAVVATAATTHILIQLEQPEE